MKIIFIFSIIHLTITADININNNNVEINSLKSKELIEINKNSLFNDINFNNDIFINGNIIFNNGGFLPYIQSLNDNIFYLTIDKNNKIWKIGNNINKDIIIVKNINGYNNNLNINNLNNAIIFDTESTTNFININKINKIINNADNFIELNSKLETGELKIIGDFNICGNNNTGSITTDNNIILEILSDTININAINGNINIILSNGIFNAQSNFIFDLSNIDDINNFALLTITDAGLISNKIDTSEITKYTNIYNQNILNLNSPSIIINSNNVGIITIKTDIFNFQKDLLITINNKVKTINFKNITCVNGTVINGTFNGDNISVEWLMCKFNLPNTTLIAYGKDFIFNNLINSPTSYLVTSNIPVTLTGTQLVLDSNEELFYLAQSSKEFKENMRPLSLESDHFLEIFQGIENTETVEDLIHKLENTKLNNIIIYDENKEPNIIEERGLMAIAAAQLNNIDDVLESLEKIINGDLFFF